MPSIITNGDNNGNYITGYDNGGNRIYGLGGNDMLYGGALADTIDGGDGGDALYGKAGNDTLVGGTGNDTLQGGYGDDAYQVGPGSGVDYIEDYDSNSGNSDRVEFSIASTAVTAIERKGNNLELSYGGSGDKLIVGYYFNSYDYYRVESFTFSDSVSWDDAAIKARVITNGDSNGNYIVGCSDDERIYGLDGNDNLYGQAGNDTLLGGTGADVIYGGDDDDALVGGTGNDTLQGGYGDDTYQVGPGSGVDYIEDYDSNSVNSDRVEFSIASTAVTAIERKGNNLELSYGGSGDKLIVGYYFNSYDYYRVESFTFSNGVSWDYDALMNGGSGGNNAPTGSVTLSGTAEQGQTLTASNTLADADGLGTISYQWLRGGTIITGATASSYQLTDSDVGQAISVRASYTDGQGTAESMSSASVTPTAAVEPGLVFGDATGLVTTEAGGTDNFTVALRVAPRHDVKLTFTISDASEAVFAASGKATHSITFTAANWATAQTVMLRGVDDKSNDGDVAYTISTRVSSSDLRYDGMRSGTGLAIANLSAQTTDDDAVDEQYGDQGGIAKADLIQGGNGASDLYGKDGRDELYGNNGDDRLYGGYGDDVLYGNADDDELEGDQGNDKLDGGTGNDGLNGGTGNDSLYGQAGNDNLLGEAGKDLLVGGAGNDTLNGGADADNMDGGNGSDVYYIDNAADVVRDSGTDAVIDTVYIMAYLSGGITLGAGIDNGALNDQAGKGNLTGNTGNNALTGNAEENVILGGEGTDTLSGGAGSDTLDGGIGSDTIDGGVGTDSLTGGAGGDSLSGGLGNDVLYSGEGDDWVDAGDGADLIIGGDGAGNDRYNGGAGIDTVKYTSATASIAVNLTTGAASGSNIGKDQLSSIENLIGGKGSDSLTGSAVANKMEGDTGNDAIKGETGNDTLIGGAGNDTLAGGAGKDSLTGGAGNDVFDFNALGELGLGATVRDVVTDFTVGQDKIDLVTIDANTALAGDQAFKLVSSFTATAGQVRYSQGIVYLNTDSDTAAEYEIGLTGVVPASLTAASFSL